MLFLDAFLVNIYLTQTCLSSNRFRQKPYEKCNQEIASLIKLRKNIQLNVGIPTTQAAMSATRSCHHLLAMIDSFDH